MREWRSWFFQSVIQSAEITNEYMSINSTIQSKYTKNKENSNFVRWGMIEKIDCLDSQFISFFSFLVSLFLYFFLRRPHSGLTDRDTSMFSETGSGRWSASRRLGQRQGTLVLTPPVHVSVRLGLVKRAPEKHGGPVCRRRGERVLVRGAGGGRRWRRAGRSGGALGRRGALLRGG